MPVHGTEGMHLFKVYILQTGSLPEHTVGGGIQVLVKLHQIAQQTPFIPEFREVALDQEDLEHILIKTEDDAVNGNGEPKEMAVGHR